MTDLQWNIYIARVSFVETDKTKLRPVMVLNEPSGEHKIVLVAPIYSAKTDHNQTGDVAILGDYSRLGLVKPSTIRLHRMVSLPACDLQEKLGQLTVKLQNSTKTELKKLFKL